MRDRVLRLPHPEIDNAWILVSGRERERERRSGPGSEPVVSFLYDVGATCAEWCPPYGPIQIWYRAEEGEDEGEPHYFYDFKKKSGADWAQSAVESEGLHPAFVAGNWGHVFHVLREWAEAHSPPPNP